MNKSPLLPIIENREQYSKIFRDNSHWEPAITWIAQKHNLGGDIKRSANGSHIVYRVGNVWIKLMAPLFAGDMVFEVGGLKTVEDKLSVETPEILAEGEIEDWKYLLLSHVEGEALKTAWADFNFDQKTNLTLQMAKIIKELNSCSAEKNVQNRFQWNDFITEQYNNVELIQKNKELPEPWLSQVQAFVHETDLSFFLTDNPIFLHADLTHEHFLVSKGESPQITAIIDFADCQMGKFEYELLAPICFIFKGQNKLLRHFLVNCGYDESLLNAKFSQKLLAWTLLHRYCVIKHHFKTEMELCDPGDFKQLASRLYPL
jgi:hygromycin-B 7''-O-kinase